MYCPKIPVCNLFIKILCYFLDRESVFNFFKAGKITPANPYFKGVIRLLLIYKVGKTTEVVKIDFRAFVLRINKAEAEVAAFIVKNKKTGILKV